jgi:hypothetical protein
MRLTAPGPRLPNPTNPIRTLASLGAAYPHILNACAFNAPRFRVERSLPVVHEISPVDKSPVVKSVVFKKFLLLVSIMPDINYFSPDLGSFYVLKLQKKSK